MSGCGAIRESGRRRGQICGRTVRGFVAPGIGRCGLHDTAMERTRALAMLAALRETRELRACPREPEQGREHDQEPDDDEPTDSQPLFDPAGMTDPSLGEE